MPQFSGTWSSNLLGVASKGEGVQKYIWGVSKFKEGYTDIIPRREPKFKEGAGILMTPCATSTLSKLV